MIREDHSRPKIIYMLQILQDESVLTWEEKEFQDVKIVFVYDGL